VYIELCSFFCVFVIDYNFNFIHTPCYFAFAINFVSSLSRGVVRRGYGGMPPIVD